MSKKEQLDVFCAVLRAVAEVTGDSTGTKDVRNKLKRVASMAEEEGTMYPNLFPKETA